MSLSMFTTTPTRQSWCIGTGRFIPSDVDGAAEEGTPIHSARTGCAGSPSCQDPRGFRFYHTHVVAGGDLNRGTYTGQAGPVYIEPADNPGAYDREVFLVLKEFEPSFSHGGDMPMDVLAGAPDQGICRRSAKRPRKQFKGPKGYEVGYELFGINGKMLGHGEPIRVKQGERVLFHVLNASAGEIRSLALPGHVFRIVALDGNPVPSAGRCAGALAWNRRAHLRDRRNEPSRRVGAGRSRRRRSRPRHGHRRRICRRQGQAAVEQAQAVQMGLHALRQGEAAPASPDETIEMTIVKQNGAHQRLQPVDPQWRSVLDGHDEADVHRA